MTMTFSQQDQIEATETFDLIDHSMFFDVRPVERPRQPVQTPPFLREKITPRQMDTEERPRLMHILAKSQLQFPATLVLGRAGTGKTALAIARARQVGASSWYSLDATDCEWSIFTQYFSASLGVRSEANSRPGSQCDIARYLVRTFTEYELANGQAGHLIVLDDIHHIFDAPWFNEFFELMIYSLPPSAHLLMLARSKPPTPLWRLRSKQMLNVVDERTISLDLEEATAILKAKGIETKDAAAALDNSFGRVSKLIEFASS